MSTRTFSSVAGRGCPRTWDRSEGLNLEAQPAQLDIEVSLRDAGFMSKPDHLLHPSLPPRTHQSLLSENHQSEESVFNITPANSFAVSL